MGVGLEAVRDRKASASVVAAHVLRMSDVQGRLIAGLKLSEIATTMVGQSCHVPKASCNRTIRSLKNGEREFNVKS